MIYCLTPSTHRTIWGGKKLEVLKNLPRIIDADPFGETWEISTLPSGPSLHEGKPLEIDSAIEELPYMVKLIDTGKALSVQVHPDDEYARIHENSSGKAECYIIIEALENAILYLGLKPGVTKESFSEGILNKKNMSEYLNAFKVMPGDFFFTPPGTIHAIGAGITMAEVQQSSGITYRVWDWDRLDSNGLSRPLHINKSLDVINFAPEANTKSYFKARHNLFNVNGLVELVEHNDFKFSLVNLVKDQKIKLPLKSSRRLPSILNLQNKITINNQFVEKYSAVLLRNELMLEIVAHENTTFLLIV